MVSRTNKRLFSSFSSTSTDNSPFSHVTPLPPLRIAVDHPFQHHVEQSYTKRSSDIATSPFTHHPLPYPPPGAIVTPTSATHPTFGQSQLYSQPHSQSQVQPQPRVQPQPVQREIKFIFETGRKEPKARKINKPKESNQKVENGGRKILGNKAVKDPNVSRKPKPTPLNLKIASKLPSMDNNDSLSHIPSPPPTAISRFPPQALPRVQESQSAPYFQFDHATMQNPYNPLRVSLQPFSGSSFQSFQPHPEIRNHTLPSINHFHSMNMVEGFGSSSSNSPISPPPLPIDAPIPKAPLQTYTPFFDEDLTITDDSHDSDMDGEYEMEVDHGYSPEYTGLGLGLDLGIDINTNGSREMMDFVPRKPSLDLMMDGDTDGYSQVDDRGTRFGMGLMGLGKTIKGSSTVGNDSPSCEIS